jgi:hypothetical protein
MTSGPAQRKSKPDHQQAGYRQQGPAEPDRRRRATTGPALPRRLGDQRQHRGAADSGRAVAIDPRQAEAATIHQLEGGTASAPATLDPGQC